MLAVKRLWFGVRLRVLEVPKKHVDGGPRSLKRDFVKEKNFYRCLKCGEKTKIDSIAIAALYDFYLYRLQGFSQQKTIEKMKISVNLYECLLDSVENLRCPSCKRKIFPEDFGVVIKYCAIKRRENALQIVSYLRKNPIEKIAKEAGISQRQVYRILKKYNWALPTELPKGLNQWHVKT